MLEITLPQPVLFVLHQLQDRGFEAYVVGGAVRDLIMHRSTNDWDFTTNAQPEDIQRVFPASFYDNFFGTVGIGIDRLTEQMTENGWGIEELVKDHTWQGQVLEITTYRHEFGYADYRRPDKVVWGKTLEDDLSRRDFTVNAMALSVGKVNGKYDGRKNPPLNGLLPFARKAAELNVPVELLDPYQGKLDLEKRLIRAVGVAEDRFREDALRMMRAIRFGAQLGFGLETDTLNAIGRQAKLLEMISWERKRDELLKILASDYPADGMTLLLTSGLLEFLIPEMLPMRGVKQGGHHVYDVWTHSLEALRYCPSTDPVVRLATMLHDVGKPKTMIEQGVRGVTFYGHEVVGSRMAVAIGKRLRLPKREIDRLFILTRWHMFAYDPTMTDAAIRRFIKRVGMENINDMMLLRVGDRKGGGSKATSWRLRELQQRIGEQLYQPLGLKDLVVNGSDVMETLGIDPGPQVGWILNQLFEEVMEESSKNNREYLLNRIREFVSEAG